jgi:hypothetical protein
MRTFLIHKQKPFKQMKTQTQHTPGPWDTSSTWNIMKGGTKIATLEQMPGNYESERMANARLISSAPDLLDALDWALRQIEDDLDPDHQAAFDAACSTLAKAKGEV